MDFYELRQVLMGNVRVIEYYNGLDDMRTIYKGDIVDIGSDYDDQLVCSVESTNCNCIDIYIEAIEEDDFLEDEDDIFADYDELSLEEQFDRLIKEE